MKCTRCGISWHKRNSRAMGGNGRFTRASLYQCSVDDWTNLTPRPHWRVKADTMLIFNGSEVHQTHLIRWVRGVIFCTRCGRYSVVVMRKLSSPCKVKRLAGKEIINPTTRLRLTRMLNGVFPIAGKDWPLAEDVVCHAFITPHLGED